MTQQEDQTLEDATSVQKQKLSQDGQGEGWIVPMPKLSPTMAEGTIARWHCSEGERVEEDDLLVEVMTDKASIEYRALDPGWVRHLCLAEGKNAPVGSALLIMSHDPDSSIEELIRSSKKQKEDASPLQQEADVDMGAAGKSTSQGDIPHATHANQPMGFSPPPPIQEKRVSSRGGASPLAKVLAQKLNVRIKDVRGTGPGGRVLARDVEAGYRQGRVPFLSEGEELSPPGGSYFHIPLSPMRRVVAERLQASSQWIPHFYLSLTIDVGPLKRVHTELKNNGHAITLTHLWLRAVALALDQCPKVNRGFDDAKKEMVQFETVDIAIAVALDDGLVTPIVRHANKKRIHVLAQEVRELTLRAKEGTLRPEEFQGGSFTISNLGMYKVTEFFPIINPPQAAILAIAGVEETPRWSGTAWNVGEQTRVVLACDHRVLDGVDGAQFLEVLATLIAGPSLLLI